MSEAGKYIAIGDIHGCLAQLEEILVLARAYPGHRLVFLGDYIDRGPDSEGVIQRLAGLDATFLLGNHEEMLLERERNMSAQSFGDLFLNTRLSRDSLLWMRKSLVEVLRTEDYIFVHAGLDRGKALADQTRRDYIWTWDDGDYLDLTPRLVVHGHTVVEAPIVVGNRHNINTGCGSGGHLTALVLPELEYLSSSPSPGIEHDWAEIRRELEAELAAYDDFGSLEEVLD